MLILSRRVGEVIVIGDDIQISIVAVKGNKVRIGIGAPRSIDVHREEVYQKIAAERANASSQVKKADQDSFAIPVGVDLLNHSCGVTEPNLGRESYQALEIDG